MACCKRRPVRQGQILFPASDKKPNQIRIGTSRWRGRWVTVARPMGDKQAADLLLGYKRLLLGHGASSAEISENGMDTMSAYPKSAVQKSCDKGNKAALFDAFSGLTHNGEHKSRRDTQKDGAVKKVGQRDHSLTGIFGNNQDDQPSSDQENVRAESSLKNDRRSSAFEEFRLSVGAANVRDTY